MSQRPYTAAMAYGVIKSFISDCGGKWPEWYVGIASDWSKRLFQDHNAPRKHDSCTFVECVSDAAARTVEKALLELGCDGGASGGDESTVYVYTYHKEPGTSP